MTFQIAICDDEKQICSELETTIKKILTSLKIKHEIDVYFSGERLCNKLESAAHYDLIFLDIEFAKNEINGIEVGTRIREVYERHMISIVYISWEMKYSMQLFDVRPLNFLIKPLKYGKIEQVIKTAVKLSKLCVDDFVYKVRHGDFRVKVKDIVYLESVNRKLILHLVDGRKEAFYGTLREVYQEQLHKFDFLHIHASYAVNYNYVSVLSRNKLVLAYNDITLPISRQRKEEISETYFTILERRGLA